jgi:lysophospholipase
MELHEIPEFRAPPGAVVGTVTASDGVRLRYARWLATRRTLGTICIFPGRSETIERYFEVVADLRSRGFAVAALDWRGQGGSQRALRDSSKGHIRSFREYDRDFDAFMTDVVLPDCPPPHFGLAHSMGGLICLRAARDGRLRFPRLVLSAPMIAFGPTKPTQPTACRIAAAITRLGLGSVSAHGEARETIERIPFDGNDLTGDRRRFERNVAIARGMQPVFVSGPTYGWLHAACLAMREAGERRFAEAIRTPALFIVGSLEHVVSLAAIERFAAASRMAEAIVIPGARHELLMEQDAIRAQFFAAFDAFIPGGVAS